MLELAITNLTSPVVLFFGLGIMITILKAKVEFPNAISDFISIYLLVAIGFKGGVAIAEAGLASIIGTIIGALALGVVIPLYSFIVLWKVGKLKSDDSAAIAGHYGSISVVTFMAAAAFLDNIQVNYEGYVNGLPALMEVPAIVVALILASWAKQKNGPKHSEEQTSLSRVTKQVVLSKSVILLLGAMAVGYFSGPKGMDTVGFFYKDIFMGMLSLFMLEMGMVAAGRLGELKEAGIFLVIFGILIPPVNAILGIATGIVAGLSVGGVTLLGVLAASSSYIVAPAAMRVSLPKANPALYLGASLGVTLPFNLIVGIPMYFYIANYALSIVKG
ncbi:MAG: sodium-dependent bicarbonate transport family permease [Desulfitobacterium hafniense]|nr:sodium-dependent bicarbonate transport family permease [Desulfitobacterium hafniense]